MGGKAASVTAMASFKENSFYQQNKLDFFLIFHPPIMYLKEDIYYMYIINWDNIYLSV